MSRPRWRLTLALAVALAPPALAVAPPAPPTAQGRLEATLRKLEKDIAAVRGLAFKAPVVARVIPRPAGAGAGVQGYYSTKDKALYLYDDVKGPYQKGVLVHEMVHALQDQHFGLAKLHATSFGSDAELALAVLVEGDATFTMIKLLEKEQPAAAKMLDVPLEKARNLQNAFLYAQGARYVRALHQRGGWPSVNARYRFPPQSTAAILQPGEPVSAINLGPGETSGAYGLLARLAGHPATRKDAVRLAAGWRGDRVVQGDKARAWALAFATPEQAERARAALAAQAQDGPGWKVVVEAPGELVLTRKGEVRAFLRREGRVIELTAADDKGYRALLDKIEGPPALTVYSAKEKRTLTFGELTDRLLEADLVCVGETHDSDLHHRVQLQIIRALHARDDRLGVGLEMFQRPYQKALDRYLRGAIDEATLLEDTEYRQRWGYDWSLYRPIVEFCRRNGLPLAALNVPQEMTRRVSRVGFAGLTAEEKKQLGPVDFHVKEHRAYWYERLARMHGKAKVPEEQKERSYQVMTLWDDYMADSAARFQQQRRLRRLVVLAGSGHIDHGFGIPQRTARRTGGTVATVRIEVGGDLDRIKARPKADFVLLVK
jgi:uncharacterized iron-regulated protein